MKNMWQSNTGYFVFFVSLCLLLFGCSKEKPKNWYKGNLHTHSYWSDGDEFPEVIMDWYKNEGYHFIALSDHNIFAEGEKRITIREDSIYQDGFRKYLEEYGPEWVDYEIEEDRISVRLKTFQEYKPLFEEKEKFLMLPAEEITDSYEGKPLHLNVTNLEKLIEPQGGESIVDVLQNNINAVLEQRRTTGKRMMVHINHPNFHWAISLEDMVRLKGERFFEVYNGHPQVHNLGDEDHIGTEEMWDFINIAYLEKGQPLLFGLATDDSHNYHRLGSKWSNAGRGWVMVEADSLSADALIASLEEGKFYSTTGVTLEDVRLEKNRLKVQVQQEEGVDYQIEFIGCKKGDKEAAVLQNTEDTEAIFKLSPDILFVRAKITSTKPQANPIEDMKYEVAWTQPVTPTK